MSERGGIEAASNSSLNKKDVIYYKISKNEETTPGPIPLSGTATSVRKGRRASYMCRSRIVGWEAKSRFSQE
jgi:hypothetical protein